MAESTFVARPDDVAALRAHFDAAAGGAGRTVLLQAPLGGGKRAAVGELVRGIAGEDTDVLTLRSAFLEEDDGLRSLLRLYASLYAALHRDMMLRGKVEMILNAQLPSQGKRVQGWYQAFIEGVKKGAPKPGEQKFDVSLPRDNPAIGFIEILTGIARKMPVVLDIQNVPACQSLAVHAALDALSRKAEGTQLLMLLSMEPVDEERRGWYPSPLLEMIDQGAERLHVVELGPWGADEVGQYLTSKELAGDAAGLARVGQGRPGFIAELTDHLSANGGIDAVPEDLTLASLFPRDVDEDELEEDAEAAEGRSRLGAADIAKLAFRAALMGRAFPSSLLADVHAFDPDSVGDLLDAAPELFEELQFSKGLNSYIYQFKRAIFWIGALECGGEDADDQTLRTARFMEQFLVPRGYEFVVRTARLYAKVKSPRAGLLRSMALTNDRPEVWGMAQDLITFYSKLDWSDPMRRTVYMNLLDRMVSAGDVNQTEALFNKAMAWAQEKEDRPLQAWLFHAGSRLDFRRQDFYRARDRARDALTLYGALNDKLHIAELENHLGMIELSDGNPTAALDHVNKALAAGQVDGPEDKKLVLPQVAARAEFIRGNVRRREKKWKEAADHFRRANEIAGRTNQAPLALESGLAFGEALLRGKQTAQAADILERVMGIAGALKNPMRQRSASQLLSQAHGEMKNFEAALKWAQTTLQLTQQLKFQRLLPIDTYQVGFFQLMLNRPSEALALFKAARVGANLQGDVIFAKELLFNTGVAALRIGERVQAQEAFKAALPAATQAKDARKIMGCHEALADIAAASGDASTARAQLNAAIKAAEAANLKEERKKLRQKLNRL